MSLYTGQLTTQGRIDAIVKIKQAYPELPIGFFDVFDERIGANGFSDERLADAVNWVIDNVPYPKPTIASFISFDKKIEINTYEAMINKTNEFGGDVWKNYTAIQFPDREKKVWVRNDDVKMYNLK
jgi:hypothetical protein